MAGCGTPPQPGTLLWVAEVGERGEVWTASPDGSAAHRLAELPGDSFPAAPDPLGTHALVVTAEDGPKGHREGLWLVPLDGTPAAPFGPRSARVRNPVWANNGQTVVFESDLASYRDLYAIPRAGGSPQRLTEAENGSFEPAVSRDRLAFGTSRDGNAEIYAAGLDGAAPTRLTNDPADDMHPGWSPDGTRLAWISHRGGFARVWTMAADGSQQRPLVQRDTGEKSIDLDFAWAPDGASVAVVVQTGPSAVDIDVVEATSGARRARLDSGGVDENPAWSPDGAWLVYSATGEIVRANRSGGDLRALTRRAGADWLPRWVPQSTR